MRSSSLEFYQLVQLTLRLLPPYCMICFSSVLLSLRTHVGFARTKFDRLAQSLTNDFTVVNGVDGDVTQFWIILGVIYLILCLGWILMVQIFLQLAGLTRPACLFQFYPTYRSYKLKKNKATSDTAKFIHYVGSVAFVASLVLGLFICSVSRRELTVERTADLERSIAKAMLQFKLRPWQGVNVSQMLDEVQSQFRCCGLNSYHDYMLEPKPGNATWEQHYYAKVMGGSDSAWKYPNSCCIATDTGAAHNCSSVGEMHRIGCYARVKQYLQWRQAEAEHCSFSIGLCIALMGGMAYWTRAM